MNRLQIYNPGACKILQKYFCLQQKHNLHFLFRVFNADVVPGEFNCMLPTVCNFVISKDNFLLEIPLQFSMKSKIFIF